MGGVLQIALINMPFGALNLPAFGCVRLEQILKKTFGDKVRVDTHYLNMDFARHLGDLSLYNSFISEYGFMTDVGDWLFRKSAFPESRDNAKEYFERYYGDATPEMESLTFHDFTAGMTVVWLQDKTQPAPQAEEAHD